MSDVIATRCRNLADLHGGTDLPVRVAQALALQQEQREALRAAADEIERLRSLLERDTEART